MKPQAYRRHIAASGLPPATRHLAHVLAMHADWDTGSITITINTLAHDTGMERKTVMRHLDRLVDAGWLHRWERLSRRHPTRYMLAEPVDNPDHGDSERYHQDTTEWSHSIRARGVPVVPLIRMEREKMDALPPTPDHATIRHIVTTISAAAQLP